MLLGSRGSALPRGAPCMVSLRSKLDLSGWRGTVGPRFMGLTEMLPGFPVGAPTRGEASSP